MDDDMMEYGSGLVNLPNGWALEKETGNKIDPNGKIFDAKGEMIWTRDIIDPDEESNS